MTKSVVAMACALEPTAVAELERALAAKLRPTTTKLADRRRDELGLLSELVRGWDGIGRTPAKRTLYDQLRGSEDPPSRTLIRKHGSWVDACLAALAAQPGVATEEKRQPWATARIGQPRPANYTREEVVEAFLECWRAIGREPSSNTYYSWAAERRRRARACGALLPRLPTQRSLERHFKRWSLLREAALQSASEVGLLSRESAWSRSGMVPARRY